MMEKNNTEQRSLWKEIIHFMLHLRLHYQVLILSGGFLLGGFLSLGMDWPEFIAQFLNVHLLLFGGATAFNSYWDKDEGPIGGLAHPPKMSAWMHPAAIFLQFIGLIWAIDTGILYANIYALSMILFWVYSTPLARWKGHPVKSLIAIGISTGTNSVLMGYLAAGNRTLDFSVLAASVAAALIVLSLYPVSQLYQSDEDQQRGDRTFALKYGAAGVRNFFAIMFAGGLLILCALFMRLNIYLGIGFLLAGSVVGFCIKAVLQNPNVATDYRMVMRIKYSTSLAFGGFLLLMLFLRHFWPGIVFGSNLFQK